MGIKINSRKLLLGLLTKLGVPEESFAATCVLIDKLEKVPLEAIQNDLNSLGLTTAIITDLVQSLSMRDISSFEEKLGQDHEGVQDLKRVFQLAEAYGFKDWLVFDPTVVRGLSYYTGIVFEGFDRKVFTVCCASHSVDCLTCVG